MIQTSSRDLKEFWNDTVLVVTDRRVASEKLIDVVDQCRLAGAGNVGVVTQQETASAEGKANATRFETTACPHLWGNGHATVMGL